MSLNRSVIVTAYSILASILPAGRIVVRTVGMKEKGKPFSGALSGSLINLLTRSALIIAVAGSGFFILDSQPIGFIFVFLSLFLLLLSFLFVKKKNPNSSFLYLIFLEIIFFLLYFYRILFSSLALGAATDTWTVVCILISSVVGSLVGIAPSGIGVSELIAMFTAPLTSNSAQEAFLILALVRVASILVAACIALIHMSLYGKRLRKEP
ncbi:hypothetical protein QWY84_00135 [Aquisalimonas lutea]|uniref:hypothetical protein n=1 Tax=Aquisalimonas lutea TaxID=1327750 RepID=UPI0025B3AC49|nr:hypothetical protein [Aquisalimonas lutea]MDN3516005.1 hypothetical protein [Aquisalimonas lutea]